MVVAFDLDDTLYFEHDFLESGLKAVARNLHEQGVMDKDKAIEILHSKNTTAEGIDALVSAVNLIMDSGNISVEDILHIYRSHIPSIELRTGAKELIRHLQEHHVRIALITDGRSETQRNKILALGLDAVIDPGLIIISEETGADKNSPIPFERLVSLCPEEKRFVYIGDNPAKDFHWPNEMGWTTIQIDNPEGLAIHSQKSAPHPSYNARHHIGRLTDAIRILEV